MTVPHSTNTSVFSFGFASVISMMLLCSSQNLDEYEKKRIEHLERLADATIVCFYIFLHGRKNLSDIACLYATALGNVTIVKYTQHSEEETLWI